MGKIFFDSDFLITFLFPDTNYFNIVKEVCNDYTFYIPQVVYSEISRYAGKRQVVRSRIDDLIKKGELYKTAVEASDPAASLMALYTQRRPGKKRIGRGEAGVIALCVTRKGVIASNNITDIDVYAKDNNLKYITTSKVIKRAVEIKVITFEQAEKIWVDFIAYNRNMPSPTFIEYCAKDENWPLE